MKKISLAKKEDNTMKSVFDKFITYKKASNLSEETISYYNIIFKIFGDFYDIDLPCHGINKDIYYDYISFLRETKPNIKDVTINSYLRGLRAILYYAMEEGYIEHFKINLIKADKELKETYLEAELEKLLKKPNIKKCDFAEYRDWVAINYFLATGNRVSTAANVKICNLDFSNAVVLLIKTKNRKQQIIPLSTALIPILKEYIKYRGGKEDDYLFCNQFGGQLSKRGFQSSIEKYNLSRGVSKTSIHLFRNTFAKNWILNGGDIFRLQKILGHSTLDMVKTYVDMFGHDLKNDFDEFNPLNNLIKKYPNNKKINLV